MEQQFVVSAPPHIRVKGEDTPGVMRAVNMSLLPTLIASIYIFGWRSLLVVAVSIASCVAAEAISQKMLGRKISIKDSSAVVTGLLFAFTLPPAIPLWIVVVGAVIAIFIVKQLFGGLGYNIFNPALAARAILLSSWPAAMTTWTLPVLSFGGVDAVTGASPLTVIKMHLSQSAPSYWAMFAGSIPGSIGETCKITLLIGAAILLIRKVIDWRTPASFIGVVALLSFFFKRDPVSEILSGGLILGAFFMATDMVTAPTTKNGKLIFGLGCGAITSLIRACGGFPEGVCYSILFMNCLTPLIDKYVKPRRFGAVKAVKG
ncbi:Na+-transporting NADH:ubiquinone oxidoreductase subunit D [Candidatus Desantisbacteria bacterium CG_4_10_14_0_8_um_filter_48_22]|uniref:Ion-translocating oxidoreductase complex subunit D n=1 Tax=Candidatus Desantisbacteria bacterium CG_4_10_14_0_8_um_filter_48_22 TaxID=1974543 RepID=A0A2M7S7I3_9BACT|nr:MAG: hypothetical protein AUJ67_05835 [Candidatus Desantisbacteria bacterium CG1_02_49_89]PIV55331.1 MAG: Na+-transporting NADH:ubiquinone oxidoreductase subunit D [Candidatus Desantisbacteria bacterium CG02_land_8_20_14_3_00_49_13]PIZ15447.1 MAG: Na+-transporting NADH:ubiquinone oxidoreductase subunit D [Candidatus Desantisbacteria bacterium CG_4_10_14_0_8_um_filter_48_22]PJB27700.1 MAG: Na+-transporting NADH:ubiquinone oxidoreductase subunit D [Candidatus Desantisbacteria bacterium CG_4_9_1